MGKVHTKPPSSPLKEPTIHPPEFSKSLSDSHSIKCGGTTVAKYSLLPSNGLPNYETCTDILKFLSSSPEGYLVYEGISFSDYTCIMDRLEIDGYQKTWKSLTFFPVLQHLMVASPSAAHESVLIAIKEYLHSVFISLPVSASILKYHIHGNRPIEGPSIYAIPDLTVLELTGSGLEDRPLWFMESAFSQSDEAVMKKLRDYVCDHPDVLVVGKVLFKQAIPYQSPGVNGSLAPYLRSAELMTRTEWRGNLGVEDFASVVVDGHTWFSLSTVEVHIWTREDGPIDVDDLDGTGYAYGTLYPTFDLAGIESALHCGISLLKVEALGLEAIQADEALYDRMEAWTPPSLLDEESFTTALVNGAWAMAYSRYLHWHNDLKGKPYATAPAHSRTSRARASREVRRRRRD